MRIRVTPGTSVGGESRVPGDKSIAHRWLILAATAQGSSRLVGLPPSLDVRSTARCLALLAPSARPALEAWAANGPPGAEGHGSTWNVGPVEGRPNILEVEGEGRSALVPPEAELDCGNSGTSMRLLAGTVASAPFRSVLTGDRSLSTRPMDRVAEPLVAMGATVETTEGHAPIAVTGGPLRAIRHRVRVPSAQVKGAILLAALAAEGRTTVEEAAATRDHTERALEALGGRVDREGLAVAIEPFQHRGFGGAVPGDPSSAAFLLGAAAVTGGGLSITDVGLNPTRLGFLAVLRRMGVEVAAHVTGEEVGEPVGTLAVAPGAALRGTTVPAGELPGVIDEVPVLAAVAAVAQGETWFQGAGELRLKESDRLSGIATGLRSLGGHAGDEGDDLVVAGTGLRGGVVRTFGDHRLAMAFAVAALAATEPTEIGDAQAADVSFPGFWSDLARLGAGLGPVG
jgi:3-phosphoshikimate 1-carboxyvinyltransferase